MAGEAKRSAENLIRAFTGLCLILVPLVMIIGFFAHPNITSVEVTKAASGWVSEFRHNATWGYAHLAVMLLSPLLIAIALTFTRLVRPQAPWLALIGGALAIFGSCLLMADKGALYMVPNAMETLTDEQFALAMPVVEAMFNRAGALGLLKLLPTLMIGFVLLGVGLFKVPGIAKWKAGAIVLGFFLLLNPDIDIISGFASLIILIGMAPIGLDILQGKLDAKAD